VEREAPTEKRGSAMDRLALELDVEGWHLVSFGLNQAMIGDS
jgi:hypothetical protein